MKAYLFSSQSNDQVSAFTSDRTGGNLPEVYGPWKAINGGVSLYIGNRTDSIAQAITNKGYYLLTPDQGEHV